MSDIPLPAYAHDIPQTKRGHERCTALLESATTLFLEYGYDAVSLDDIVKHAGGSKTSIYKYFGNKEGLFTAICDYRREQFFQDICVTEPHDVNDIRLYLIHTLMNFHLHLKKEENTAFLRLILEQTQRDSNLAHYIHDRGPRQIQLAIAKVLKKAHLKGLLKCENPLYSAQFYFGILRNIEWKILMNISVTENDQETLNYITYCVDLFLYAHQKS
ncbi:MULTISPECIES: TetR/AcrR family transcriptional regulator [unclassified Acinetobacter]|uniref:TetR/AcrR family transcriptional regulator n=1 Tax=unclassified Acinetobacter TaxID=196816 RepID=UPI0029350BFA|nr:MULTISPECIES: TetR/AcrR family transcriptional regulator [unclassified Acinetobacter]WOE32085.1 TetR/AcrR family transcriptional regulator [Acinetobacter sp. SAAs470]WOE37554.1 TetR/AcrR family transcriptional regulator [Acinetobacter sp. SAAs474]